MQYTALGRSDIKISKVCLGGMSFGEASLDFQQWTIGPEATRGVIARAPTASRREGRRPVASRAWCRR